jgi:hypothetical protein
VFFLPLAQQVYVALPQQGSTPYVHSSEHDWYGRRAGAKENAFGPAGTRLEGNLSKSWKAPRHATILDAQKRSVVAAATATIPASKTDMSKKTIASRCKNGLRNMCRASFSATSFVPCT